MTKIYTKGGDKGQTGLFSGERVSKNNPLINALGTVDELNSVLGIARGLLKEQLEGKVHLLDLLNDDSDQRQRKKEMLEIMRSRKDEPRVAESITMWEETEQKHNLQRMELQKQTPELALLDAKLHTIQLELFELGAELASGTPGIGRINDAQIERFERWIDELTAGLPELKNFILPTGHPVAAHLHQARTVCRRAERMIVAAQDEKDAEGQPRFDAVVIRYMNRLNDLLFVLAREGNRVFGVSDEEWHSPKSS